jgi:hypothetical protein
MVSRSPTKTLQRFLFAVRIGWVWLAYRNCQKTWRLNHKTEELYYIRLLPKVRRWKIVSTKEIKPEHFEIRVAYKYGDRAVYSDVHVLCESEPYTPTTEGRWGVNPISFLKYTEYG